MTSVCSTSVESVKFLMSQNPNIACTFSPACKGSTSPPAPILAPIILEPASPNPRASRCPILIIAFSMISVSYCYSSTGACTLSISSLSFSLLFFYPPSSPFCSCVAIIDSTPACWTSSEAAARGFF